MDAKPGETFNIGADNEWSNIDIVHYICDQMDKALGRGERDSARNSITFVGDRPGNDLRYAIDSTKLETELNWKRQFTFEICIKKTIMSYLDERGIVPKCEMPSYKQDLDHLRIER